MHHLLPAVLFLLTCMLRKNRAATAFALLFLVLAVAATGFAAAYTGSSARKVKVAVFPFNDLSGMTVDMRIASLLTAELATRDFIETVPIEVVRRKIVEIEPALIRTEKSGPEKTGIIYWQMSQGIVEEIAGRTDADFAAYGDISWFDKKWTVSAHVSEVKGTNARVFTVSGDGEAAIPAGLEQMATDIAVFVRDSTIIEDIEEEVRKYLGGVYSLPVVISKLENVAIAYQDSLPVQAVLLDLYLRDRPDYRAKIAKAASKIIALYDPSNDTDTRYLLSRSLDPFDIRAGIYEENREWAEAIKIREKALEVFSFDAGRHKAGIERDRKNLNSRKSINSVGE